MLGASIRVFLPAGADTRPRADWLVFHRYAFLADSRHRAAWHCAAAYDCAEPGRVPIQRGYRRQAGYYAAPVSSPAVAAPGCQHLHAASADHCHFLCGAAGIGAMRAWQVIRNGKFIWAAVVLSIGVMVPLIILAERRTMRGVLLFCIGGLLLTQVLFGFAAPTLMWLFVGITLFFCFLNTLESVAAVAGVAHCASPAAAKGSAMGIYSSSQFFGAFVGGVGAGWLDGHFGRTGLFVGLALLCAVWGLLLLGFQRPRLLSTHRRALTAEEQARGDQLVDELTALPGVEEVVLAVDEGVAYMKVDKTRFQATEA